PPQAHPPRARGHKAGEGEGGDEATNDLTGVGGGGVYAVAWRDVAVGNVCAAPSALPASIDRRDQWDSYALMLQYLDHAQGFGTIKVLSVARRALLKRLTRR
ncbi:MAG: hypothetical protein AAGE65_12630, partial [Planctomycetota bacterium]